MNIKRFSFALSTAGIVLLTMTLQSGVRADDIDIYVDPVANAAEAPMVMFSVDYNPNLTSTVCHAGSCSASVVALYTDGHMLENPATQTIEQFHVLRGVMKKFIKTLKGVKIGLMLSHGSNPCPGNPKTGPTANKCSNGGYILHGFKLMQEGDGNGNKAAIIGSIDALPSPQGNLSHKYQGKELFFEFYRYLSGRLRYNSHNGWEDYGTNNVKNLSDATDSPYNAGLKLRWDTGILPADTFIAPITDATKCAKIYTVNILLDQIGPGVDDQSDTAIKATVAAGGIPGIPNVSNLSFNQVLKALFDNDVDSNAANGRQTVTSYFVVSANKINNTTRSYAGGGQGKASAEPYALTDNPDDLIEKLEQIFRNILSISTTFVAPTVAVNVYNRAQVQDDVYIAMFQAPDPLTPLWPGNLKKYRIGTNIANEREIQDANGAFAVDTSKGRIKAEALSYWTISADLPNPAADELEFVDNKDGRGVNRGGAGSKIPGVKLKCSPSNATDPDCYPGEFSPGLTNPSGKAEIDTSRKVFYDKVAGASTSLAALNADVATATELHSLLGGNVIGNCTAADAVANPISSCNTILYARGAAYIDDNGDEATSASPTPRVLRGRENEKWILGDLLHSRPIAVNYGARPGYSEKNPDVRVIAGSNDGLMHMFRNIKAGQTTATPNELDGVETWAFMPREVMPVVKTLMSGVGPPVHPYTVDGSPVVFIVDDGDGNITAAGDKVWLFFGLRRGGKSVYALDITDPDNPTFMWKITQGPGDFAELGQTWSTPQTGYMLFDGSQTPRPVLVFGGGYDPNKDTHPGHNDANGDPITSTQIGSNDSTGNAFFVVNAETGALVWKAIKGSGAATNKVFQHPELKDSVPSEVTTIDTNGNVLIDRAYFGDTGGRLWRVDMFCHHQDGTGCESFCQNDDGTPCATAGWKVTPILSVGRHDFTGLANDRRFFYAPDFAKSKDSTGSFDAIILGTGDRETPKDKSVKNWFYMYKDRYTRTGSIPDAFTTVLHSDTQLGDVSNDCLQTGTCAVGAAPDLTKGWKMRLHCQEGTIDNTCGEKNLAPALTLSGTIFFTTYIPPGNGGAACTLPEGGGLFYAVSLQEGFAVEDFYSGNGTTLSREDRATTLASGGIPAEVVSLGGSQILRPDLKIEDTKGKSGFKTYWYEKYLK